MVALDLEEPSGPEVLAAGDARERTAKYRSNQLAAFPPRCFAKCAVVRCHATFAATG